MDQKRTIIAIALSMAVLLGWQFLFAPDPPEPKAGGGTNNATTAAPSETVADAQPQVDGDGGPQTPTPTAQPAKDIPQEDVVLQTDRYRAVFTNRGARLKSFIILSPEQYEPRGDLIKPLDPEDGPPIGDAYLQYLPFATTFSGKSLELSETAMYEVADKTDTGVVFRYTDPRGRFALEKSFTTNNDKPYSFDATVKLENTSGGDLNDALTVVMYGHQQEGEGEWSLFNPLPDVTEAVCMTDGDIERAGLDDAGEGVEVVGPMVWGGVDSRYFTTEAIFGDQPFVRCNQGVREKRYLRTALTDEPFAVAAGTSKSWQMASYVGPKETDLMETFGVGLERIIDYGIFEILCRPIHWLLVFFHGWVGNWGVAIILLTLVLRGLMFPINQKGYKNMEGMRRIQEPMKEIREKYENDPMKQQEKIMELYKKEKVSPLGCLPQLLQIPIFFALYRTIYNSVELFHADFFLWYTDLSAPDPYFVLPVLVAAAMFGQQLLMPTTATNPQMKYAMYAMPLVFSVFVFVLPAGLGLYIVTSTFLGILQQYYIRKKYSGDDTKATAKA